MPAQGCYSSRLSVKGEHASTSSNTRPAVHRNRRPSAASALTRRNSVVAAAAPPDVKTSSEGLVANRPGGAPQAPPRPLPPKPGPSVPPVPPQLADVPRPSMPPTPPTLGAPVSNGVHKPGAPKAPPAPPAPPQQPILQPNPAAASAPALMRPPAVPANGAPAPALQGPPRLTQPQRPAGLPPSNPFSNLPPVPRPSSATPAAAAAPAAPPAPPTLRQPAPPPQLQRLSGPAGPPRPPTAAPPPPALRPPPAAAPLQSPNILTPNMPAGAPPALMPQGPPPTLSTPSADNMTLRRPQPPPVRVLDPIMRPTLQPTMPTQQQLQAQQDAAAAGRPKLEVVEDDEEVTAEDDEFLDKKGKKKRVGRKEKVTAEMKRAARKAREAARDVKALAARKEREEIFEVGNEGMSLEQLAEVIQIDPSDIVRSLFMKGITLSMNQVLDKNTCKLVAAEYGLLVVDKDEEAVTDKGKKRTEFVTEDDIDDLEPRPPVVTVMGHVDHGKTSLLDYIRKARVAAGEAGGITQGIGAYNTTVEMDGEEKVVCFLDTPGHEAFSAMRARGTQVTDIAIIIVAADDGVRPQTKEAVAHAQAAEVPILVAINKMDKPGADVERVKRELLEMNLVPEEWGGNTPMVAVSAKKGTGIADLLQMVSWMAEEKALMANPKKPARGTVIEAHLDRKIGPVATLLVQTGTLKVGDIVSAGPSYGKVRTLRNDLGNILTEAGPSIAVQMVGLGSVPVAGEEWGVAPSESAARAAAESSVEKFRNQRMAEMTGGGSMVTLSSLATIDEDTEALQKLNLIIKGDTVGVVEAIKAALNSLPQQSVTLRHLLTAAGDISISDVELAAASTAMVLGFNLSPDTNVEEHAKRMGVKLMTYKVIYDLIDDVKAAMEGKLRSIEEKVPLGKAEVKALFGSGKKKVAGCAVTQGKLAKGAMVCVRRGTGKSATVVFEGKVSSLRRVKDTVDEVGEGFECGLACEDFLEWQAGDSVECYQLVTKNRRLEDARAQVAVDLATLAV